MVFSADMTPIIELEQSDFPKVQALLSTNHLPHSDIAEVDWLVRLGIRRNLRQGTEIIAFGGLERCGSSILLRSVVVSGDHRGQKRAHRIIEQLHELARQQHFKEVYLLTTDAADYFSRTFAYNKINRDQVPADIARSSQFSHLCPGTADLMRLVL